MTVNELIQRLSYVDGNKTVYVEGFNFSGTIDMIMEDNYAVYLRIEMEVITND